MKFITGIFILCFSLSAFTQATEAEATRSVSRLLAGLSSVNAAPDLCSKTGDALRDHKWRAGAPDCETPGAKEPPYEVVAVDNSTYVLRQNKCLTFEAPFIYLYVGTKKAFLFDTGATYGDDILRRWVDETLSRIPGGDKLELVVAHSHSHGDHTAGDGSFSGRPNTQVIGHSPESVAAAFGIQNWPEGEGKLDLGGRELTVLPIPGHEPSSIAVYDSKTKNLLTGDTFYPGNIFLSEENFPEFRSSINRLHTFTQTHPVHDFLGAHVEMSAEPGKDYTYGSTYQPNEHRLPLTQENLDELQNYLSRNPPAESKVFNDIELTL
jgi:glyoxylase-like metal-dependent hydrolase (beta-lactamase superfamily II)